MRTSARWPAFALFLVALTSCRGVDSQESAPALTDSALRIGFGGFVGTNASAGLEAMVRILVEERLVNFAPDGRVLPNLIDRWTASPDRKTWQLHLSPGVRFHDGTPVTSQILRDVLRARLPGSLGGAAGNLVSIDASGEDTVAISLNAPSNFLVDGLELLFEKPGTTRNPVGTGPFQLDDRREDEVVFSRNAGYRGDAPAISEIHMKQYGSLRSAWADMLRGQVDMLYEVGVDALGFLEGSQTATVYTFQRPYVNAVLLNMRRQPFKSADTRRALNAAIDRAALVSQVFYGHAVPASGPISPFHWAYDRSAPTLKYSPSAMKPLEFTCLLGDRSQERLGLAVQQQLQEVGVTMHLEMVENLDEAITRLTTGDFDAFLADTASGPHLFRPSQFWTTNGVSNYGKFSNPAIDSGFERIDRAASDSEYREAVASLQRAFLDDPPAIFLAWGQRARAVSTRFAVPVEPGRDVFSTVRLWRPLAAPRIISTN